MQVLVVVRALKPFCHVDHIQQSGEYDNEASNDVNEVVLEAQRARTEEHVKRDEELE